MSPSSAEVSSALLISGGAFDETFPSGLGPRRCPAGVRQGGLADANRTVLVDGFRTAQNPKPVSEWGLSFLCPFDPPAVFLFFRLISTCHISGFF